MSARPATLVVDIGNTSTSLGIRVGRGIRSPRRIDTGRATFRSIPALLREVLDGTTPDRVVMATVVPAAKSRWTRAVRAACGLAPVWVDHRLELGVPVDYPDPASIGADRLANACWAAHRFGTPCIVADFGTALTFDILHHSKGYVGGVIAPGLPLMLDYLAERTAQLPRIEPAPVRRAIGRSTTEAMRIGARHGYRGMVREILEAIRTDLGTPQVTLCATGGYARWVLRGFDASIHHVPHLTLLGLARIGDLNPAPIRDDSPRRG